MQSKISSAKNTLASNVKRLRILRKLSQAELATNTGIIRNYLNQIEMGTANPSLVVIVNLAMALDASPHELLTQHAPEQRAVLLDGRDRHHFDSTHPMREPPRSGEL